MNAAPPAAHPSADELMRFALGQLDDADESVVAGHLDGCPFTGTDSFAMSRDGRRFVLASKEGLVTLWERGPIKPPETFLAPAGVASLAVDPEGAVCAVGDREGAVRIYQLPPRAKAGGSP